MRSATDLRVLRLICYFLTQRHWKLDVPAVRAPVRGPLSVAYAFASLQPYRVPWEAVAVHIVGAEVGAADRRCRLVECV